MTAVIVLLVLLTLNAMAFGFLWAVLFATDGEE